MNLLPAADFSAASPAVAYDSVDHEYAVAYYASEGPPGVLDKKFEIFAQRLSGEGGEIGPDDQRIASMGPEANQAFDAPMVLLDDDICIGVAERTARARRSPSCSSYNGHAVVLVPAPFAALQGRRPPLTSAAACPSRR